MQNPRFCLLIQPNTSKSCTTRPQKKFFTLFSHDLPVEPGILMLFLEVQSHKENSTPAKTGRKHHVNHGQAVPQNRQFAVFAALSEHRRPFCKISTTWFEPETIKTIHLGRARLEPHSLHIIKQQGRSRKRSREKNFICIHAAKSSCTCAIV